MQGFELADALKSMEVRKKSEDTKSTVESDVCIIYFNIFRSSHINRLLLHPFPVRCIRFVLFILFLFFIIFAIVVNAEFFAHGWRIHNIWELTEWHSSTHIYTHTYDVSNTITNRAERLNKMLHWQKLWLIFASYSEKHQHYRIHVCRYEFCCVKKNDTAFLFVYLSLFANKIDETDKNVIIFCVLCVYVCAHPLLWSYKNNDVHSKSVSGGKGTGSKSAKREMQEYMLDRQTLTIKYAMKIRGEQHQHMLSSSLLYGFGKIQSETKCLLFIVEMDVIWAQNPKKWTNLYRKYIWVFVCCMLKLWSGEWAYTYWCVCMYVCALKLEILSARSALNSDKKRIIRCFFSRPPPCL